MASACENMLKERLIVPSGYKRIGWTVTSKPLSAAEYRERFMAVQLITDDVPMDIAGSAEHTLYTGVLEYDAPNAHGASIRQEAVCDLDASDPSDFEPERARYNLQINGLSHLAWLTSKNAK